MTERRFFPTLFSLEGRAALVTGASGGIGRALALGLAEAGAVVALHGTRREALEELRGEIEANGGRAVVSPADLGSVAACRELAAQVYEQFGRLDILVNCAGMNRRKPIAEVPEADFERIVDVNLKGPYFLTQAVYPFMREQGGGKIINIGSITSSIALGRVSVYGATKAALAQLTQSMALEWAKDNIQVNCLAPGFIRTPLTDKSVWQDPHSNRWLLDRIPAKRAGTPEDLVGTTLLLASAASDYLTGQLITVDGGFLAGGSWFREDE